MQRAAPPPPPIFVPPPPAADLADLRRAALARDYTTPAIVTLVLYFVLFLPGLIANVVYLTAANNDRDLTGREPQGRDCLTLLLACFVGLPVAGAILLGVLVALASLIGLVTGAS